MLFRSRTLITLRQLIAPGFYLALLALLVSALLWPSLWGLFGLALGAYVAALLSCGLLECGRRRQIQLAPLVAVVSAAMHVGYAAGYFRRLLIRDVPGTYWGS